MLGYAAFVFLCFLWGSTWLVIKVGYGGLGPFNVAALRFFVAGFLLVPLVPMLGARWPRGRDECVAGTANGLDRVGRRSGVGGGCACAGPEKIAAK